MPVPSSIHAPPLVTEMGDAPEKLSVAPGTAAPESVSTTVPVILHAPEGAGIGDGAPVPWLESELPQAMSTARSVSGAKDRNIDGGPTVARPRAPPTAAAAIGTSRGGRMRGQSGAGWAGDIFVPRKSPWTSGGCR